MSEDLGAGWSRIQDRLRASVGASTYDLWFSELRPVSARGTTLYVTGPAQKLAWVERRYPEIVEYALARSDTPYHELRFVGDVDAPGAAGGAGLERATEFPDRVTLNPEYTFERFVIGAGNRVAHAAGLAVAESPGEAYNPLFLHGPPGLGKTHLLGAIANYISLHSPELTVHYTTAERFTNEFVFALHSGGIDHFKDSYRRANVLLIDDVQFLEGKSRTADEFFHTFNALYETGAQIVLSADRLPGQLSALAERLRQRFQWGLTVEVEPPDELTRIAFLDHLVRERPQAIDRDSIEGIADRVRSNLRTLRGALTRVLALSSLTGSAVTLELVERAIPSAPSTPPRSDPDVTQIQRLVAERLQLEPAALSSPSRAAPVTQARQLAMHLTRELTDLSLPAIATSFGRRDHSTVIHALRRVQSRLDTDIDFQILVGELTSQLSGDQNRS